MSGRVIVVGSVNVDLVAHAERLPAAGETVTGGDVLRARRRQGREPGGRGRAARARRPRSSARSGRDAFGMRARAALDREGIDLTGLTTVDGLTGVALILVDAGGENMIAVASGANAALTPSDIATALDALGPAAGDVVLVGHEIPTISARHALKLRPRSRRDVVFNPAPATGVDRSAFGLADVLTVNRLELAVIVATEAARLGRAASPEHRPVEAARTLLERNADGVGVAQAVVVTLGAGGAVVVPATTAPRSTTRLERSGRSTPSARATRSPARWRRVSRRAMTSSGRPTARSRRRRSRPPGRRPRRACRRSRSWRTSSGPDGGRSAGDRSPTARAAGRSARRGGQQPGSRTQRERREEQSGLDEHDRRPGRDVEPVRDVQAERRTTRSRSPPRAAPASRSGPSAAGRSPRASRASRRRG